MLDESVTYSSFENNNNKLLKLGQLVIRLISQPEEEYWYM